MEIQMEQRKSLEQRLKENRFNDLYIAYDLALDFSVQVNDILKVMGITRKELSERMGCSRAYVTQILDGHTNLTFKSMGKIAAALQMDIKAPELYHKDLESFDNVFNANSSDMALIINDDKIYKYIG